MGESEHCEEVGVPGGTGDERAGVERRPALHVAAPPGAGARAAGSPGAQAFAPWYGSGVDVAGAYSRSAWRERLAPGVWEVWVALGRRLRSEGGFAVRPSDLVRPAPGPVDEARLLALDEVVHRALVELALNGLARRTDEGDWQVRPNCPISSPRVDKSYTVTHYEHLAAAAASDDADGPDDPALRPVEEPPGQA